MTHITRLIASTLIALALASSSFAQVELKNGRVWLNGERQSRTVWIRSCFKLANQLTYTYTGQGGGEWGTHSANAWVNEQIGLGFDGCRVLLETAGWRQCESGAQANDGTPQNCMWGSEPVDKGAWNVDALRRGGRPTSMHGVAKRSLRWFFEKSQATGFVFELVIIATLKHDDVSQGQQTHVIRQTLSEAHKLQKEFPQANIVMSAINEFDAHSPGWSVAKLNLVAVRADRWKHPDGRTVVGCSAPPGFEAEQWPCGPLVADGGGGNTFEFDVGPEPGKLDLGALHPERDENWFRFPNSIQKAGIVKDSRTQPWAFTESMFLVELEDIERGRRWYPGHGDRWTTSWTKYEQFLAHVEDAGIPWMCVHDEKGVETKVGWPRAETRVDRWAREHLGGEPPPPPPPPPEPVLHYDHLIEFGFLLVLERPPGQIGADVYNPWFRECYADKSRECMNPFLDVLARSDEYEGKNTR